MLYAIDAGKRMAGSEVLIKAQNLTKKYDDYVAVDNIGFFNYPGFLFITSMFLLSGTFFPLASLPEFMQVFAKAFLPLTHVVDLSRGLIIGNLESSLLISLVWIAAVTPIFFVLSINLMKRKLIK